MLVKGALGVWTIPSVCVTFNSSPSSATYMRQWTRSTLVQVMVCCLFGAKPLPEPMLAYCQLDSWEQTSVKFELIFYHFRSIKCFWNCRLPKWRPFCPGGDRLIWICVTIQLFVVLSVNRENPISIIKSKMLINDRYPQISLYLKIKWWI